MYGEWPVFHSFKDFWIVDYHNYIVSSNILLLLICSTSSEIWILMIKTLYFVIQKPGRLKSKFPFVLFDEIV